MVSSQCKKAGLIQEGADNIDLNTETIDGKDTFHSMAHAVFQTCRWHDDSCLRQLKVRRGQERTFQLTESVSTIMSCPDLFSNHKEADTRMLLHAIHADARFSDMNVKGRIINKPPDTDVLLLCIHFFPSMRNTKELWFKTGTVTRTKDGRRYLPVHDICHIGSSCMQVIACSACFNRLRHHILIFWNRKENRAKKLP